jgi:hypothetical protein
MDVVASTKWGQKPSKSKASKKVKKNQQEVKHRVKKEINNTGRRPKEFTQT